MSARNIAAAKICVLWASMGLIAAVAVVSEAAAFDCSKALSPAEKSICADPSLARMDREMGPLFGKVIQNAKDAQAWKADQRAWLKERDSCKNDPGCLRSEYQDRLTILRNAAPPAQWAAHWWRVDATGANGSELVIKQTRPNRFDFDVNASAGANSGELEGTATLDAANTARYQGIAQDATEGCSLVFRRVLNRLNVEQTGDSATCGAGMGVSYSGTYVAGARDPNAPPDLISLGVLQTNAQDHALRKLLGKDYDTMAASADMIDNQAENLDGNGATVVSMAVRGSACNTKSVLMFDSKDRQWAAVWQPASGSQSVVELRYYTNVAGDKNTLPKTISAQREACTGDTVRVRIMP